MPICYSSKIKATFISNQWHPYFVETVRFFWQLCQEFKKPFTIEIEVRVFYILINIKMLRISHNKKVELEISGSKYVLEK